MDGNQIDDGHFVLLESIVERDVGEVELCLTSSRKLYEGCIGSVVIGSHDGH